VDTRVVAHFEFLDEVIGRDFPDETDARKSLDQRRLLEFRFRSLHADFSHTRTDGYQRHKIEGGTTVRTTGCRRRRLAALTRGGMPLSSRDDSDERVGDRALPVTDLEVAIDVVRALAGQLTERALDRTVPRLQGSLRSRRFVVAR